MNTVGRPETATAHPEKRESNRTSATPAVDSTIAGETRHTVNEPRTLETNSTVEPDSRRSMPVQLFAYDRQLPDLGISGDSNLWHDGYSYRQDKRKETGEGYNGAQRGARRRSRKLGDQLSG